MSSGQSFKPPPCIILLNGFPGVGKLTMARALQKAFTPNTHSMLLDNHSIIDTIERKYGIPKNTPEYYAKRKEILRRDFLWRCPDYRSTIVMTASFAGEPAHDIDQWIDHVKAAWYKGVMFVHVNIRCDMEENKKRLVTEERINGRKLAERGDSAGKMKNIDPKRMEELRSTATLIDPRKYVKEIDRDAVVTYFEMDNTKLSVGESVEQIQGFMEQARGSKTRGVQSFVSQSFNPVASQAKLGGSKKDEPPRIQDGKFTKAGAQELDPEWEAVEHSDDEWVEV